MPVKDFQNLTRKIKFISIHCSDSDYKHHDNVETLREWHVNGNGWSDVGYNAVVCKSKPAVRLARDINRTPAAVAGKNTGNFAICITGKHKFTKQQFKRCRALIEHIYELLGYKVPVYPHKYFDNSRSCPNFDVKKELGLNKQYVLS